LGLKVWFSVFILTKVENNFKYITLILGRR
jgi:hypothetical protein